MDENKVVSGSYDRTLKVWDLSSGQCHLTLRYLHIMLLQCNLDCPDNQELIISTNFSLLCKTTLCFHTYCTFMSLEESLTAAYLLHYYVLSCVFTHL